jgi:glycosyltransferase involved in cell wall biosynthesis
LEILRCCAPILHKNLAQPHRPSAAAGPLDIVVNGRFLSQRATGVQRVAQELVRAFDRLLDQNLLGDTRIRVIGPPDADAAALALRHIPVRLTKGVRGHLWEQFVLPRHIGAATLLCLGNTAPASSLLRHLPVATMLHDQAYRLFPQDYSAVYRFAHQVMGRLLLERSRPLFLVSDTERQTLIAGHGAIRASLVVTPNGSWMDDDAPAPVASGNGRPERYGLFVGSFTARKNFEAVLQIALALATERNLSFRFVGPPGPEADAARARIPWELRHLVVFEGYVPNDQLARLYSEAAFLLYPSHYEASGLPPSEAMTFGCPVIVSDLPVLRERCGQAALYCDPHDLDSIRNAVLRIVDDPDKAAQLAHRGRARAAGFTWRSQALAIIEALRP